MTSNGRRIKIVILDSSTDSALTIPGKGEVAGHDEPNARRPKKAIEEFLKVAYQQGYIDPWELQTFLLTTDWFALKNAPPAKHYFLNALDKAEFFNKTGIR